MRRPPRNCFQAFLLRQMIRCKGKMQCVRIFYFLGFLSAASWEKNFNCFSKCLWKKSMTKFSRNLPEVFGFPLTQISKIDDDLRRLLGGPAFKTFESLNVERKVFYHSPTELWVNALKQHVALSMECNAWERMKRETSNSLYIVCSKSIMHHAIIFRAIIKSASTWSSHQNWT